MFDIRDHGGPYESGKYRKGSVIPISDLGISDPPSYNIYTVPYNPGHLNNWLYDFLYMPSIKRLIVCWKTYTSGTYFLLRTYTLANAAANSNILKDSDIQGSYIDTSNSFSNSSLMDLQNGNILFFVGGKWYIRARDSLNAIANGTMLWDNNQGIIQLTKWGNFVVGAALQYVTTINLSTNVTKQMSNMFVQFGPKTAFADTNGLVYAIESDGQMISYYLSYWQLNATGDTLTKISHRLYEDTVSRQAFGNIRLDLAVNLNGSIYAPSGTKIIRIDGATLTSSNDPGIGYIYKIEPINSSTCILYSYIQNADYTRIYKMSVYNFQTNTIVSTTNAPNMTNAKPINSYSKVYSNPDLGTTMGTIQALLTGVQIQ